MRTWQGTGRRTAGTNRQDGHRPLKSLLDLTLLANARESFTAQHTRMFAHHSRKSIELAAKAQCWGLNTTPAGCTEGCCTMAAGTLQQPRDSQIWL